MNLSTLNPEQRRAVTHRDGPILVLAGAGSGKTRVITTRIAHLIACGVAPENILGVTFTNKAAAEMRERVAHLVAPEVAKKVNLGTFHALGVRLLRAEITALGFDARFSILDEGDKRRVMRDVLKELNLSADRNEAHVLSIVSRAKNARTTPARLPEARYDAGMPRAQRVFDLYNRALRNLNAVDFDDLLLLPTRIFDEHTDIRDKYRERFRYVLVDEYQDTNPIQMHLLQQLVGPPHNLMAVGDDDQSIYRFRGAVADNILRFGDGFPGTVVVALEQNYRSVGSVLALANTVIARNTSRHAKTLWSELGDGVPVRLVELEDEYAESDHIAAGIADAALTEGRRWSDFAVLYRSNSQTSSLEESLRKHNVPYRILGGQSLFDRKEIKDVLAYFRLVVNPNEELSLRRVINFPSRGIGTTTFARLDDSAKATGRRLMDVVREAAFGGDLDAKAAAALRAMFEALDATRAACRAATPGALPALLGDLVRTLGLEQAVRAAEKNPNVARIRWEGVEELLERVGAFTDGGSAWDALDDYVQVVTLDTSNTGRARDDEARDQVTLTTIHSSKGLEFPVVYLCGMSDDLMPHENAKDEPGGIEEERRLCYVGITRARERLVLTRSCFQLVRNERTRRKRSRFLDDLPPGMLDLTGAPQTVAIEQKLDEITARAAAMRALLGSS